MSRSFGLQPSSVDWSLLACFIFHNCSDVSTRFHLLISIFDMMLLLFLCLICYCFYVFNCCSYLWYAVATYMFDIFLLLWCLIILLLWFADTSLMFDAVAMSFISRLFFFIQRFWDFNEIIFKRRIIRIYQICLELLNWSRCTEKEYQTSSQASKLC